MIGEDGRRGERRAAVSVQSLVVNVLCARGRIAQCSVAPP